MSILVFDNTALSHFARAHQLEGLESLVHGHRCVTPTEVARELLLGVAKHPAVARAIDLTWVEIVELTEIDELVAFARYKTEFGGGPDRNNGDAAVLAWAAVHGATAIVDERPATRAAHRDGIEVHGTLWLICNGLRQEKLTRESAERMVDELAATAMYLPVDGAGLIDWAYSQGLLP